MDTTAKGTDSRPAPAETAKPAAPGSADGSRLLGTAEMIERMAHAMRLRSGLDLPHAYFVEQVKLQLAGSPAFDRSLEGPSASRKAGRSPAYHGSACFEAWAMRD